MKSDRRVIYTKRVIKKTLLELLEKQTLEKITIKALCGEADINRATFYRHYNDIYDLFEHIEGDIIEALYPDDTTNFGASKYILAIYNNQSYYKEFFQTNISSTYMRKVSKKLFNEIYEVARLRDDFDSENFKYAFDYALYGTTGILREWVLKGCVESPEKLNFILFNLIKKQLDYFE